MNRRQFFATLFAAFASWKARLSGLKALDPETGIGIRFVRQYSALGGGCRIDVLPYRWASVRPEYSVRIEG